MEAARQDNIDKITAGGKVAKAVNPTGVGGRGAQEIAATILQLDGHIDNARFTGFLDAIAVNVIPNPITQRAKLGRRCIGRGWGGGRCDRLIDPSVDVGNILARAQVDGIAHGIANVDVTIQVVIRPLGLGADLEAAGDDNPDRVTTGAQTGETIGAATIGGSGADQIASTIFQLHDHIDNARFTTVLHPIAIEVIPDKITDGAELRHRGVGRRGSGGWRTVVVHASVHIHGIAVRRQRN